MRLVLKNTNITLKDVKSLPNNRKKSDCWKQRVSLEEKDEEKILSESFREEILFAGRR